MPAETHVEGAPMERNEVFELIRDRLADILEIEPDAIKEGDSFSDDLDADSLALIELVEALEEELGERSVGFRIDDEDLEDLKSVRDAVDYVVSRLDAGPGIHGLPERDLDPLVEQLGYRPSSSGALGAALAHRSWCAEHPGNASNERLEFLGDAVLGLAVTDMVFARFPAMDEGGLTDLRKSVVNAVTLAEVADEIGLGDWLLLGKGEERSGGRLKPSILSDALEAVIGAVYVDGGIRPAVELVERLLSGRVDAVAEAGGAGHDHKSRLQELVAQRRSSVPDYVADATGPDHARVFTVTVRIDGEALGEGVGRSKKQAEQRAAQAALASLDRDLPPIESPPQDNEASPQEGTPGA